jgi:hypothetical protein
MSSQIATQTTTTDLLHGIDEILDRHQVQTKSPLLTFDLARFVLEKIKQEREWAIDLFEKKMREAIPSEWPYK